MSAPAAPAATRWPVVLLVVLGSVVVAFQIGKMPASLPVLRAELGLSLVAAGWTIAIFSIIGGSVGVVAGALGDWLGHRRIILWGLAGVALGSLTGAFAETAWMLLGSRVVEGAGAILVFVASPVVILRATAAKDVRAVFGVWGTYMPTGMAIMVLLTPALLAALDWRGLWLVNAALLAAMAVILAAGTRAVARPSAERRPPSGLWHDIRATVIAPGPVLLGLSFGVYAGNYLAVMAFLPTFLTETRAVDAATAAMLTGFAIAANVIGNLLAGWLMTLGVPRWRLMATACLLMGLTAIGIYEDGLGVFLRYALCLVFSAAGGLLPASVMAGAPVLAPSQRQVGTTNGLIFQLINLGQLLTSPALAIVVHAGGWGVAPVMVGALALVGIALAAGLGAVERRATAAYEV